MYYMYIAALPVKATMNVTLQLGTNINKIIFVLESIFNLNGDALYHVAEHITYWFTNKTLLS